MKHVWTSATTPPLLPTPSSKTRLWVKAVVSDKTEEMKGSLSAPTSPLAATCATDVGFSLHRQPFSTPGAVSSVLLSGQRTAVFPRVTPVSCPTATAPQPTLVNMSKVGRAPWTHMSHFLDMSHCALNSLPLCSFMAFLWGHFSATIRSVSDSCSRRRGEGHSDPPDIIDPQRTLLHFARSTLLPSAAN